MKVAPCVQLDVGSLTLCNADVCGPAEQGRLLDQRPVPVVGKVADANRGVKQHSITFSAAGFHHQQPGAVCKFFWAPQEQEGSDGMPTRRWILRWLMSVRPALMVEG